MACIPDKRMDNDVKKSPMKKLAVATSLALFGITLFSPGSKANEKEKGFYVTTSLDLSSTELKQDNTHAYGWSSWGYEAGVGYDFGDYRIETSFFKDNGNALSLSNAIQRENQIVFSNYSLTAYRDFHNTSEFTPFIGASVGISDLNWSGQGHKQTAFSTGLSAGIDYKVTNSVDIFAKGSVHLSTPFSYASFTNHDHIYYGAKLGTRYRF